MNNPNKELVSIGLLIYNAEKYLKYAIESLLKQDYENFEIVISDNCSTDKTEEICRYYAKQDSRISYHRNKENIGAAKNYDLVFRLSKGKYFAWASFDDVWHEKFISKCVECLESHPDAVMCAPAIEFMDEDGVIMEGDFSMYDNFDTTNMTYLQRFKALLLREGWYSIFGMVRRNYLEDVKRDRLNYGADVIILSDLIRQGDFVKHPDKLFYYRNFRKKTELDRYKTLDSPSVEKSFLYPNFSMYYEIMLVALKGKRTFFEKLGVYFYLQSVIWSSKLWKRKTRDEIKHYFYHSLNEKSLLKIVVSLPFFLKFYLVRKLLSGKKKHV
ncbi:MAG: glycosyltransferase family 2 protein [Rickettsiales bacterium]|nr:glycosyltransferase family 2 protein [Rickettsiales bacterium]